MATIPQAPRQTGDIEKDIVSIFVWAGDLFRAFVVDGLLVDDAPTVVATNLPDPSSTSLAAAQQTANDAYNLAVAAQAAADTANDNAFRVVEFGSVTISNLATTGTYTFADELADTDYTVIASPQTFSGAPNIDAFVKEDETKATTGVTIQVNTAPGAGTSVTFNILILKEV